MVLFRILLFPLAVLYDGLTRLRNLLFDIGWKPSASFSIPVIGVGNLVVGGTGKTPMTEYLMRLLLAHKLEVASLSRGYGRKTKGMRLANSTDTAETIGDEPLQLYNKFHHQAVVSVCEERALAIPFLADQFPNLEAIVLDDAYQHRYVKPGFSILLTAYDSLFYNDFVLPSGRLRESRKGALRADLVVVTKCPEHIEEEEMINVEHAIRKYANRHVFFSKIRYGEPHSFEQEGMDNKKVVLVSGLAKALLLEEYVRRNFTLIHHFGFNDHHIYSRSEIAKAIEVAGNHNAVLLTTEKDYSKIAAHLSENERKSLFYLPIEIEFVKGGSDFDAIVLDYVKQALASINE